MLQLFKTVLVKEAARTTTVLVVVWESRVENIAAAKAARIAQGRVVPSKAISSQSQSKWRDSRYITATTEFNIHLHKEAATVLRKRRAKKTR